MEGMQFRYVSILNASFLLPLSSPFVRAATVRSGDCFILQSYRKYMIRQIKNIICFLKNKNRIIFAVLERGIEINSN